MKKIIVLALLLIAGIVYPIKKIDKMNSYLNIKTKVSIGEKLSVTELTSIKISKSVDKLTDTAMLIMPREYQSIEKQEDILSIAGDNILDHIAQGNQIIIEAGYNNEVLTEEFIGYIADIGAEIPLKITCEDEMYQLKIMPKVNKVYKDVSLKKLLTDLLPGYTIEALDVPLGKFTIERATPYKVLEELKKTYGLRCYFRGKTLHAGLVVDIKPLENHIFIFSKNIRGTSNLQYKNKESRKLFIKASSMQTGSKKKKVTYEYGDRGGDQITLHAPINLDLNALQIFTEKTHASRIYDGYDGDLESWGLPKTSVGDVADIKDPNYSSGYRDMKMLITGVIVEIDSSKGFKRTNKLGLKL